MRTNSIVALFVATQLTACVGVPANLPNTTRRPDLTLNHGRTLTEVFVEVEDADESIFLFYRTSVSLSQCKEIQTEVREVWSRFFRAEADKADARRAVVFPEDADLRSQGFRYVRADSAGWSEDNFCGCSANGGAIESCH